MECTININKSVTIGLDGLEDEDIQFLERFCKLLVGYRNEKNMMKLSESKMESAKLVFPNEDLNSGISSTQKNPESHSKKRNIYNGIISRDSLIKGKNGRIHVIDLIELKRLLNQGVSVTKIMRDTGIAYTKLKSSVDLIGDHTDDELISIMNSQMTSEKKKIIHNEKKKTLFTNSNKYMSERPSSQNMRKIL